ncbi:protein DBF4 homolog A [Chanos chanos]|uniref:Protein DBF4 homolog A n=1 Tax=Chanos chanos TaxID=29144 RepID=A0A6J2WAA1_CHACN|nr:protein DBF4 homolog A [Chanos chanos]
MKNQTFPRSTKSKSQGAALEKDKHKKTSTKSNLKPGCDSSQNKPLTGKIFYLDVPCNKRTQTLENDIKTLGGTVEKFFSKEIRYLVSSKPEARHARRLGLDSPIPSPDSGLSSPHPASKKGSSQGQADTAVVSRGKALVEKVIKEQERIQMNRMLANAVEWGVKVLYIDDIISYIERKKTKITTLVKTPTATAKLESTERTTFQKHNAGRISRPFVKVEDSSRHYRPIYLPMLKLPVCSLRGLPPCSPFYAEENDREGQGKRPREHREERHRGRRNKRRGQDGKEKRKGGYCECCIVKYDSLKAHLQSEQHQAFSKSEEYLVVDKVIAGLTCDLIHTTTPRNRPKCSISSPVLTQGPVAERMEGLEEQMEVKREGLTEEVPLWASTGSYQASQSVKCSREKPHIPRKRNRELFSCSHGDRSAERSDVPDDSRSKRGFFDGESYPTIRKALGKSSLLSPGQGCSWDASEQSQTPHYSQYTKQRTQQDTHSSHKHSVGILQASVTADGLRTTCKPSDVWMTEKANCKKDSKKTECEPSLSYKLGYQMVRETPVSLKENEPIRTDQSKTTVDSQPDRIEKLFKDSESDPIRTGQPSQVLMREPISTDDPSAGTTLRRKVRGLSRRRKVGGLTPQNGTDKHCDRQTVRSSDTQPNNSTNSSDSTFHLWQLFQSSDSTEEEFKGFQN